jgi:hypothetical protein
VDEAVRLIEADANRSAGTHLHPFPLPAEWGIQRDIVATLRQTLRPLARQASARPVSPAPPAAPVQPATGAG